MKQFDFINQRPILKHLILGVIFVFVVMSIVGLFLRIYTKHNSTMKAPDFTGIKISKLDEFISDKDIYYQIIDSVYMTDFPKGAVFDQEPAPDAPIKPGRTIYLTVTTKTIEKIKMPNLIDLSLRQALDILATYGLKPGRLEYVADIAENAILKQKYKGKDIAPETMIAKGSFINLTIGRGLGNAEAEVPSLIGKRRSEAIDLLYQNTLNLGSEVYESGADSLKSYVIKQSPSRGSKLRAGSSVNLWYSPKKVETNNTDETQTDEE